MSKLYCAYDHSFPKEEIADHKCDICGKLLCHICGYEKDGIDYCNECWESKNPTATNKQKPYPKNNKCENCHEKNCEFLKYDDDLEKWICDACKNGKEIEERASVK